MDFSQCYTNSGLVSQARLQCKFELELFARKDILMKDRPEGIPEVSWNFSNHSTFSPQFKDRVFCLLCCIRRSGWRLPDDLIIYILSMLSIKDDIMTHIALLGDGQCRIYSFDSQNAIDVVSTEDFDGGVLIMGNIRRYPNAMDPFQHSLTLHSGGSRIYWKHLRDDRDFSWRVGHMDPVLLTEMFNMLFGETCRPPFPPPMFLLFIQELATTSYYQDIVTALKGLR